MKNERTKYHLRMRTVINIFLTIIILAVGIVLIIDYIKNKDNVNLSPDEIKEMRKNYFMTSMLVFAFLLLEHIERFFR